MPRWECRYSSCEMYYIEVSPAGVHLFLDHHPQAGDWYTFDQVDAGAIDGEVRALFGDDTLAAVRAAATQMRVAPPAPFDKQADMRARRAQH